MKLLRWIIGFLIAIAVAIFAVSNRHTVDFYFSPIQNPINFPLYIIGLVLLTSGFLLGTLMTWLNSSTLRKNKRKQSKQIKTLEKTLEAINENGKEQNPPSDFFPALPKRVKK